MSWDAAGRELVVGTVIRLPLVMEHYLPSHHRGRNWVISTFARDIPGVIFVRPEDDAHASPVLAVAARYVQVGTMLGDEAKGWIDPPTRH